MFSSLAEQKQVGQSIANRAEFQSASIRRAFARKNRQRPHAVAAYESAASGSVPAGALGMTPRAARRAVASGNISEAPRDLCRSVGLPVAASARHFASG